MFRNMTVFVIALIALFSSFANVNAETISPEKEQGFHILDAGFSGDNEIETNWLYVRENGDVVAFSVYNSNYKGQIHFISMLPTSGQLTDNEFMFWTDRQVTLEMAMRSGNVTALAQSVHLGDGVAKFIIGLSGRFDLGRPTASATPADGSQLVLWPWCGEQSSYDDGFAFNRLFEDCSVSRETAR